MELSNELFFILFSLVMLTAVVWFIRSASRFKAWSKGRDENRNDWPPSKQSGN
ncbi:MAG: hypothetical protein P8M73_05935 [Luminiphilus sp.]|jgi:hypothetical protein|nr:hypothetical protein [Luminiphilus sp.]